MWAGNPRLSNKDIGEALGLSPSNPSAPVGQAKLKVFKAFFEQRAVEQYLESKLEQAIARDRDDARPTRAPSSQGPVTMGPIKWAKSIKRVADRYLQARTGHI